MSVPSILLAVPTYKNQLTATTFLTTHALTNLLRSKGIEAGVTAISSPDIEWVRNFLLTYWYDKTPRYSHLLFIDDDMGFLPDIVIDMLLFNEPVVGALYPKKVYPVQWAVSGIANPESRGPFLEVEGLGCGCFLIRRDAVTTMIEKMPHLIDTKKYATENDFMNREGLTRLIRLFNCIEDEAKGRVSEDISFCRRWRECGGQVWAATHHKMVHVGPHEYAQTYAEWAAVEMKKDADTRDAEIAAAPILKERPALRGKACKHGLFIYNPNDTFIGASMEAYGEWCEYELDLLQKFIKEGDTVIDVGANIGTHAIAFSRMVGKSGKVFAFEPQPRLEAILAANVHLNKLQNVFWSDKAVGNEDTKAAIPGMPDDTEKFNFGSVSILHTTRNDPGPSVVDMITIDSFAADMSPSVIKIDVEGMEAYVIGGAMETIKRCRPILYIENNGDNSAAIAPVLDEIDYRSYWSIGPFFNPMNSFKNPTNIWGNKIQTLSANLIAVPNDEIERWVPFVKAEMPLFIGDTDNWRKAIERMAAAHHKQAAE